MPQRQSTSSHLEPHHNFGQWHTLYIAGRSQRAGHATGTPGRNAIAKPPGGAETESLLCERALHLVEHGPDDQILPFDNLLRIALLVSIGLFAAIFWALLLWGVAALIQLSIDGAPRTASSLISESTLWIAAVVWPIAFLGLAIVCIGNDRQMAEQDAADMNKPRRRANSWRRQD